MRFRFIRACDGIVYLAKLKKYVATGWTQFYEYCGRQYEDFVLTSGSTAKFENTRKRKDAVGSVPKDKVIEDLHNVVTAQNIGPASV